MNFDDCHLNMTYSITVHAIESRKFRSVHTVNHVSFRCSRYTRRQSVLDGGNVQVIPRKIYKMDDPFYVYKMERAFLNFTGPHLSITHSTAVLAMQSRKLKLVDVVNHVSASGSKYTRQRSVLHLGYVQMMPCENQKMDALFFAHKMERSFCKGKRPSLGIAYKTKCLPCNHVISNQWTLSITYQLVAVDIHVNVVYCVWIILS